MTTTGGSGSYRWEVNGTLSGWFWVCRCGESSELVHGSERAAVEAATAHVAPGAGTR